MRAGSCQISYLGTLIDEFGGLWGMNGSSGLDRLL
jgi:hypothetical protein